MREGERFHPAIRQSEDVDPIRAASLEQIRKAKGRPDLSGWRKRFRDENGNPLPEDGVRIEVK